MPTAASTAKWPRALEESEVLLKFAAGAVSNLDPAVIAAVAAARTAAQADAMTPMIETGLWAAYNRLAAVVRPVTVDSLYASTMPIAPGVLGRFFQRGHVYTIARRSARRFFALAIFVLIIVLFFQILVAYMQATISNINAAIVESTTHLTVMFDAITPGEAQSTAAAATVGSVAIPAAPAG
ncbi:MAG: hypothetical protein JNL66_08160, partial [Alphaproteobacteria bacterium]|nr:hypothetical protein [Alphaproteobacteria bacterium]